VTDRPRALIILVAVFLLGGIVGASGAYFWLKNSANHREPAFVRDGPQVRGQGRQRLPELLQLTSEQEARFREIMTESRKRLGEVQKEQRPKIDAIRDETNRKFLEILNDEQRKKFEKFLKQAQERMERMPRGRQNEPVPPPPQ
jgi:DNA anti-recombination protein RmuC